MRWLKKLFAFGMVTSTLLLGWSSAVEAARVYWLDKGNPASIKRANLDGSALETLAFDSSVIGINQFGLALDSAGAKMYWVTDESPFNNLSDNVLRAGLEIPAGELPNNRTDVDSLVQLPAIARAIALDVPAGKMYLAGLNKIQRANLDGTALEDVVTGLPNAIREGIALDLVGEKIYWTNQGTGQIRRANMDGSGLVETVVNESPSLGGIDIAGGKIFWVNFGTDSVRRANLDGSGIETLVPTGGTNPRDIAVDVAGGKMYWVETLPNGIRRANLDGSDVEQIVAGGNFLFAIALELDSVPDADGDGVDDGSDDCPGTTVGPVDASGCSDAQVDIDGDGYCDVDAPSSGPSMCVGTDNCPTVSNPDQIDSNGDGFGDACVDPSVDIPDNANVDPTATIGAGTEIDRGVTVGPGVDIGENVELDKNVVVGANTSIGDGAVIDKSVVLGANVTVGIDVIIGRDAVIKDGASIGDRSVIDRGAFIGANAVIEADVVVGRDSVICQTARILSTVMLGKNAFVDTGVVQAIDIGGGGPPKSPSECAALP